MSSYIKCVNANTMEIRLVKLNAAVKRALIKGEARWAKRKRGEQMQTADLLIIEHDDNWEKLLPYFDHTAEINGRRHGAKWKNE